MIKLYNQKVKFSDIWKLKYSIIRSTMHLGRMFNYLKVLMNRNKKDTFLNCFPTSAMIEPSSRCNLKCPMCISNQNKLDIKIGDMTIEQFKNIIDQIKNTVIFLFLWNSGEPFMNKELSKMIEYAHKKRLFIIMSTNGYFVNKKNANMLINNKLDYLIISFDGATRETYEKIRFGSNYDKVIENIEYLIQEKKRVKKSLPYINLQFLVMRENEHEIHQFKQLAKKLSVDRITIKKTQIVNQELNEQFIPLNKDYTYNAYSNNGIVKVNWCYKPWEHIVVNWDGSVFPCCDTLDPKYSLGNFFNSRSYREIWNNQKYVGFRKKILTDIDSIDICKICPGKTTSNEFLLL